jgi:hypothetical protein
MKFGTKEKADLDKFRVQPRVGTFPERGFGGNRRVQPHILRKSPLPIWPFTHHKDAKIRNTQEGSYACTKKKKEKKQHKIPLIFSRRDIHRYKVPS